VNPPRIWKTGERCRITCAGRTVDGLVLLASGNGLSLMVGFEAILAGHAGMMPLSWEHGEFRSLVEGTPPVTLA
jgi:hypothetical protein